MAANISTSVGNWTTVPGSNQPDTTDPAASICDDLHAILAAVRKEYTYDGEITVETSGTLSPTARVHVLSHATTSTIVQMLGMEGQERTLVMATGKSPVFKHSASLVMPGATDMQCSAGDVVSFIFENASTARCASFALKDDNLPRAFTINSLNEHWGTTAATEIDSGDFTITTTAFNSHLSIVSAGGTTAITIVIPATTFIGSRPRRIYFRRNNRDTAGVILIRGASGESAYYDNAGCDLTTIGGVTGIAYKGGTSCHGVIEFFYDGPRMGMATTSVVVTKGSCLTLGS